MSKHVRRTFSIDPELIKRIKEEKGITNLSRAVQDALVEKYLLRSDMPRLIARKLYEIEETVRFLEKERANLLKMLEEGTREEKERYLMAERKVQETMASAENIEAEETQEMSKENQEKLEKHIAAERGQ